MDNNSKNYMLSAEEYNVLQLVTGRSKTDCWFWLVQKNGVDMVEDLEEGKIISLREGLIQLHEAISDVIDDYGLSQSEKDVLFNLFDKFHINK